MDRASAARAFSQDSPTLNKIKGGKKEQKFSRSSPKSP